jgi:predicted ATPase/DNA-binding CsgD family transcriptional regulator
MKTPAKRSRQFTGRAFSNNLPRYLTSFVGRESDLAALNALLAHSRMVTLVGPGGAGKSRLAAELARSTLDLWPEGVCWVELAVKDPSQVAGAVASALGLPGRGPAQDVVIGWLVAKRTLLVLDNCEHLLAACTELCQAALERCEELTIIATSRAPLGVPGETQWPVSALLASDAVPLFEARAAQVRPNFKVTARNLEAVTQICERVDRLPLAIELAASRIGMLSEAEILSQLSDRFHLLAGGTRSAPERQQTMRATIEWSYRLLTDDEALLFCRLSVFQGGFSLESAHAVCGSDLAGTFLELLAGLVQKSMVVADRTEGSSTRYRLLESQLAYAADQLQQSGELEFLRRRHYEYFRARVNAAANSQLPLPFAGTAAREWIPQESGNLWAALGWARHNTVDLGLSLAVDFEPRDLTEARTLIEDLLAHSAAGGALRARALNTASFLAWAQGDFEAARQRAESSVSLTRTLGEAGPLADALNLLGMAHQGSGQLATAGAFYDEALALVNDSASPTWMIIRNSIGVLAVHKGDYSAASEILREVVRVARSTGHLWLHSFLDSLACAQLGLKDYQAAVTSWREVLTRSRDLADDLTTFFSLEGLACVASLRGDDGRALRLVASAKRMASTRSLTSDIWLSRQVEESQRRSRSRLGVRKSDDAWNQGWAMTVDQAIDYALGEIEPEVVSDSGPLSRREQEVAKLVAEGMTNRQIAERLFIAERSAEGHVERIRNKLGVRSRAEVAVWAVTHRLADDPDASGRDRQKTEKDPGGSLSAGRRDD